MFQKGNKLWDNKNSKRNQFKKGYKPYNVGKHQSKETKEKIADRYYPKGKNHPSYGKHHTEDSKKLMSKKHKEWFNKHPEFREKLRTIHLGKTTSEKQKKYMKERNPVFSQSYHQAPNKSEQFLNQLLQSNFPNEFKFVGDGSVILDGLNPDFIDCNGKKLIIELFNEYHHNLPRTKERDKRRLEVYSKYGYRTLIIWFKELKSEGLLTEKLKEFIR